MDESKKTPVMPTPASNAARLQALVDQGKVPVMTEELYEEMLGAGADFWESDEELDEWLEELRRSKRGLCRYCQVQLTMYNEAPMLTREDRKQMKKPVAALQPDEELLEAITLQQGVIPATIDELMGFGKECFDSEEDFEAYLQSIRETRAEQG